jgi:hypothetical protein
MSMIPQSLQTTSSSASSAEVVCLATATPSKQFIIMLDIENEIKRVAKSMKAPIPIGPPLHQIKKLIEVLEERRRTQLKFTPERMKHWQENYNSLILARNQILNETPKA